MSLSHHVNCSCRTCTGLPLGHPDSTNPLGIFDRANAAIKAMRDFFAEVEEKHNREATLNGITFHDVSDRNGDKLAIDFSDAGAIFGAHQTNRGSRFINLNPAQLRKLRDVLNARHLPAPETPQLWTER